MQAPLGGERWKALTVDPHAEPDLVAPELLVDDAAFATSTALRLYFGNYFRRSLLSSASLKPRSLLVSGLDLDAVEDCLD
jgi:hypothetical protein